MLRARRVEQAKHALALGVRLPADAYVFSHEPDGSKPIRPMGSRTGSPRSPRTSGSPAACTTCGTSWSPS
jgi:hypothetical protein